MITATHPDTVRSHDEAKQLLQSIASGARVEIVRLKESDPSYERARWYEITIKRHGRYDLCVTGVYSIPCSSKKITDSAIKRLEEEANGRGK